MNNYSPPTETPPIIITGGDGQLATAIYRHPLGKAFHLIPCSHHQLDITQRDSIVAALKQYQPQLVINTAAYTAVDRAESEREHAALINHYGAFNLATICEELHIPLIHLSTNYIFDGRQANPYREDDQANPINYYGETKWLGEKAVREQAEKHLILRVGGLFGEYGHNFLKTILRLATDKTELRMVTDQLVNPTYTGDIAYAILTLAKNLHTWGTYHFVDSPACSWYEFTLAILDETKNRVTSMTLETITPVATMDYPTKAMRPLNGVLDSNKIMQDYQINPAEWRLALKTII